MNPPPPIAGTNRVVPLTKVHPNPWNYNRQSDFVFERERASIRANGFLDPLTVRRHPQHPGEWEIIDGEHRYKAALAEGMESVPVVDLGDLATRDAKKLCVVLNETKGDADRVALGALLKDLQADLGAAALAAEMPFQADEIDGMIRALDFDWSTFDASPVDAAAVDAAPDDVGSKLTLRFPQEAHGIVVRALEALKAELPELRWS